MPTSVHDPGHNSYPTWVAEPEGSNDRVQTDVEGGHVQRKLFISWPWQIPVAVSKSAEQFASILNPL